MNKEKQYSDQFVYRPDKSAEKECPKHRLTYQEKERIIKEAEKLGCYERGYITDEELEIIGVSRDSFIIDLLFFSYVHEPIICDGALENIRGLK